MRDKQRYLLIEMSKAATSDEKGFSYDLYRELVRIIGEINYHKVNPKFIKFSGERRFVIKSSLAGVNQMILAFALIKRINNTDIAFYTLKSSGTIKALMKPKE